MIQLITDSTADLGRELTTKYKVNVVPLPVTLNGREYRDGVDITTVELFEQVGITSRLPQTAAPSVGDFLRVFLLAQESLYIGISSQLSATHQNACLAAKECLPRDVRVIDSLNLSTGIGLLVLKAAEMRDRGCPIEEIEQAVRASIPKVRTSFVVETLEYLWKGGRCSAVEALIGSMLKIRPVIEVRPDGSLGVKDRVRGSRKKALSLILDEFESRLPDVDLSRVFVTHTGCQEDAQKVRQEIIRIAAPQEVLITEAGAIIASHCGPETIGLLYLLK